MKVKTLFWDLGGVVLTNAWDHHQRAAACARFGLDAGTLEAAHARLAGDLECGRLGLDDYLAAAVFDRPRGFTGEAFREFMRGQSGPLPGLGLLAEVAAAGRVRLGALNNESLELNRYRIARFGLDRYFQVLCSSCYLGARKPEPLIFERALGIVACEPAAALFLDDREANVAAARAAGLEALVYENESAARAALTARGLL